MASSKKPVDLEDVKLPIRGVELCERWPAGMSPTWIAAVAGFRKLLDEMKIPRVEP